MIIFGKLCFCVMFLQARRFTNLQTEIEHDSYLWCNDSTGEWQYTPTCCGCYGTFLMIEYVDILSDN